MALNDLLGQCAAMTRKDEILAMRWDELDFASRWRTTPGERAKNRLAHRVWLNVPAQRLLKELRVRRISPRHER